MDPLTRWAVIGTSRQEHLDETAEPLDALAAGVLAKLPDASAPQRILLAAGARAVATVAGAAVTKNADPAPAAAPETRPACSAKATRLLEDILREGQKELLLEALALLDRAGLRLPHALLPGALGARGEALRSAARRVLGERGPWLARMNPAWEWATTPADAPDIAAIERAWLEGASPGRRDALARARAIDPAKARAWLEASWSSEKADERAAFLTVMATGISDDDEPFVSAQLRDRASAVRDAAQALLPRLVRSAFVARMIARTDAVLHFSGGALSVKPPESTDPDAARDGLSARPPQGVGALAFWLSRALSAIPPSHWRTRFDTNAATLVHAAEKTDWAGALCEGWTKAALLHEDPEWLAALWEFWQRCDEKVAIAPIANAMLVQILQRLPPAEAASRVEPLFGEGPTRIHLSMALCALASPWPESIGLRYIAALEREIHTTSLRTQAMMASLRDAALALPHAVLPRALQVLAAFEREQRENRLTPQLLSFMEVLRVRHELVQEIHP
ncbi:DUF5691 domain-containing protein [Pendulispora brunnea]|uniref:DUF5691 domain-containing protein n=1 Tax=Pendulispora brunnea TaxID=2905690 RepID=A0ABZ2JWT1_9BACT